MKLGNVCSILNGFAFRSENYIHEGIRIIRISNVQKGYIEDKVPAFYPYNSEEAIKYELECGDILISLTGNVGRVAILTAEFLPATLNQRVACLRIKNESKLDKSFLFNYLNSDRFEQQCIVSSKGVAQKNMSTEWLKEYELPDLTIKQQKEISQILSELSALIFCDKRQLAKLDELVKSRFIELFGDPMTDISKWSTSTIGEQFNVTSGGTPATGEKAYWENGTIPWIGSNMCQDTILSGNDGKFITEEGYTHSSAKWFHKGTVLVALVGATIGKTALLRFDTTTNQNIAAIDVNNNAAFSSEFVFYHMQMLYSKFMEMGSGKFKMANQGFIRQLPLICPPIEMQDQFATFVEQVDKSKLAVKQSLEKLETLKKSLMQEYFG